MFVLETEKEGESRAEEVHPSFLSDGKYRQQLKPLKGIAAINQVHLHRLTSLPLSSSSSPSAVIFSPHGFHLCIPPHPRFLSPSPFISISPLSESTLIDEGRFALIVFD